MKTDHQNLCAALLRAAKKEKAWAFRVENVSTPGTPDVFFGGVGFVPTWIEAKIFEMPKRSGTPLIAARYFKTEQQNWHVQAARKQIPSWILAREKNAGTLYFVPGADVMRVQREPSAETERRYAMRGWDEILRRMRR